MSKDLNQVFEELLKRYIKATEKDYQAKYKKAKDKEFVVDELTKGTDLMIQWEAADPVKTTPISIFTVMYKRGDDINKIMAHIRKTCGEIEDVKPYRRIVNEEKITLYLSEEEKALKALALNERKLLKILIRNTAYKEIKKRLPSMFDQASSTKQTKGNTEITWTGSEKNKNEFVQLIYGLHQAGLINKGKGEITKITETLAETFGVDLGKNWQSNHSSSIHRAKLDYEPAIFDKIKEGYYKYIQDLTAMKKKKK